VVRRLRHGIRLGRRHKGVLRERKVQGKRPGSRPAVQKKTYMKREGKGASTAEERGMPETHREEVV